MESGIAGTVPQRIARLRRAMERHGLAAWISPMGDPHLSEYVPGYCAFIRYLTGFTGSAATVAVTGDDARLWTDSRYWEQAARELQGAGVTLMRDGAEGVPPVGTWLAGSLEKGAAAGIDGCAISEERFNILAAGLAAAGVELASVPEIVDETWDGRPLPPMDPAFVFEHGQQPSSEKVRNLRREIAEAGAGAVFISTLDDVAWLTNCRGSDIECNPVFTACALVTVERAVLFADGRKIPAAVREMLQANGWEISPYEEAAARASELSRGRRLFLDEKHTCADWAGILKAGRPEGTVNALQPTSISKSRKTEKELELLRETMAADGAALCGLFCWVEKTVLAGGKITEWDVSEKLLELRRRQERFIEPSFDTIAAADANAAEPHYAPTAERHSPVTAGSLLLVDSGGQYLGGTTDVTRTVVFREPSAEMKRDYTAVLRGHINLARAVFPEGAYSSQLDTLARAPLWEIQADYGHGTGHGVGFCLCVHEGPVSISPRAPATADSRVWPGLVVSDEPGVYRPGRWGVRIENLVTPRRVKPAAGSIGSYLSFETLTLCPYDDALVERNMLLPAEKAWYNGYSELVRGTLAPRLSGDALEWLMRKTRPL